MPAFACVLATRQQGSAAQQSTCQMACCTYHLYVACCCLLCLPTKTTGMLAAFKSRSIHKSSIAAARAMDPGNTNDSFTIQISPDGKSIAFLAPSKDKDVLNVWVRSVSEDNPRMVTKDELRGIRWAQSAALCLCLHLHQQMLCAYKLHCHVLSKHWQWHLLAADRELPQTQHYMQHFSEAACARELVNIVAHTRFAQVDTGNMSRSQENNNTPLCGLF